MKKLSNYQLNMLYQFKLISHEEFTKQGGALEEKTIVINLPSDAPKPLVFEPVGFVTDVITGEAFWFDDVCTVPALPAVVDTSVYGCPIKVYDSVPVLAPCRRDGGATGEYLHPDRINESDRLKLADYYRQIQRELAQDTSFQYI